jgi:hypothetical protein
MVFIKAPEERKVLAEWTFPGHGTASVKNKNIRSKTNFVNFVFQKCFKKQKQTCCAQSKSSVVYSL